MIITYSNQRFKDLILSGEKIHTIRPDPRKRWKPGRKIQHWMGNPRNPSKNPHCFAEGACKAVQHIRITRTDRILNITSGVVVQIDGRLLMENEVEELAKNDGLIVATFRQWFVPPKLPDFTGRIIHFTDKMY